MNIDRQTASGGDSCPPIHAAALAAARAQAGLSWLDVGCGKGHLLRMVKRAWRPAYLAGIDVIDWLEEDLREDVDLFVGPAEDALRSQPTFDRILMIETLEHLEAPWTTLRAAARHVAPGGRIVVTAPNLFSLRHRFELLLRGQLTAFRPDNAPHVTPVVPHVVQRVLADESLASESPVFAGRDIIPFTGGRQWPEAFQTRAPSLIGISVLMAAERADPSPQ